MKLRSHLQLDVQKAVAKIKDQLRLNLRNHLHRRGYVVALSGGVDSSVCAALAVQAVGENKVYALLLPETDSSNDSVDLGRQVAEQLKIRYEVFDIAPTLAAIGCYRMRDQAIRKVFPAYTSVWKSKIAICRAHSGQYSYFKLVVQNASGEIMEQRLRLDEYLQIIAATNYKQRIRKTLEYYHADRLNYAVIGTPNRLEYDQGFFVKNGDGSADIKPIAHLYKTQVYALAEYLGLPSAVCKAIPSTDTYSMEQGQDEFYFTLPFKEMDVALWSYNNGISVRELAEELNLTEEYTRSIYNDIDSKRRTTAPLHWNALTIGAIQGPLPKPEPVASKRTTGCE